MDYAIGAILRKSKSCCQFLFRLRRMQTQISVRAESRPLRGRQPFLQIRNCGVFLKKSEPILRRTPTNEDPPPPPRGLGGHQRKMLPAFRICLVSCFVLPELPVSCLQMKQEVEKSEHPIESERNNEYGGPDRKQPCADNRKYQCSP